MSRKTISDIWQFDNLSKNLYGRCVSFIENDCTDVQSFLTFVQENEDKATVMTLLQDIKTAKRASKYKGQEQGFRSGNKAQEQSETCSNCKEKPCRNGLHVQKSRMVKTLAGMLPMGYSDLLCVVVNSWQTVMADKVKVAFCDPPTSASAGGYNPLPNPFEANIRRYDFPTESWMSHFTYACDQ